jgi:hypothetical protein
LANFRDIICKLFAGFYILFFQKGEANSHPRNILDITKYKRRKERGIRTKTPSKPH